MLILFRFLLALNIMIALILFGVGCSDESAPESQGKVTLLAVGDVFFARGVGKQTEKHGSQYPFLKTKEIIKSADIAFCNLECTLSKRGLPHRRKYIFRADPEFASILHDNGFDVACLANNHTLDFGRDAMLDTQNAIEKAGMLAIGVGKDKQDSLRLHTIRKNGLVVGFIGYTDIGSVGVVRLDDRPTVAGADSERLPAQIRDAKSKCDVLVVSFHWGIEYMKRPTERQQMLARLCIDNGADLILGHHPHVLQTVEIYKGKPIVYSMGGFIWDSKVFGSDKSAIYIVELHKSSASLVRSIPVKVRNGQPSIIDKAN